MNTIAMIRIGDVLTRPKKDLRIVTHAGVVIAPGLVLQNTPDKGEHLTTLQDFTSGEAVAVLRTGANPSVVAARAQAVLAKPSKYDVLKNNCEHTVTKIVEGISRSPQLLFILFVAAVILVSWLVLKRK
jgi:hypothetical protein